MRNCYATFVLLTLLFGALSAYAQEALRDPTRPYDARPVATTSRGTGASRVSTYDVTAIFTSDSRRVAVVNGKRVIEGDKVDGATVVEIMNDRLSLDVGGNVITTRVLPIGFRK